MSRPHRRLADACAVAGIEELTLHGLCRSFRPLDLLRLHHERLDAWILEQAGVEFDPAQKPGKLRAVGVQQYRLRYLCGHPNLHR